MPEAQDPKLSNRSGGRGARRVSGHSDNFLVNLVSVDDVGRVFASRGESDRVGAWVSRQQLDLITSQQLHAAGITPTMIKARQRRRTLHRVHHGVYLWGTGVMRPAARELAAALAYGDGTRVRRRSALSLLAVVPPWTGPVEVAVVGRGASSRDGIAVHRIKELPTVDCDTWKGIPIVSPALALLEFAVVATGDELELAIAESYAQKHVTEPALRKVLERYAGMAGTRALRAELDRLRGPQLTKRQAARKLKLLIRAAQLPPPLTEHWVEGYRADFYWPQFRLIVETDGYQYHGHRYAFERDHKRDQKHVGYKVLRFTWRQLTEEPYRVIAVIAMAIGAAQERLAA